MSTTTTNYSLIKPALTDPADITLPNSNWDKIDTELYGKFAKSGGTITGDINLEYNVPTMRFKVNDTRYARLFKNSNQSGDYGTLLGDYTDDGKSAELILRAGTQTVQLRLNGQTYDIYGTHKKPTASDVGAVSVNGGSINGDLQFQRVNNGKAAIYKNHNATADYGLSLTDIGSNNKVAELSVVGASGQLIFTVDNTAHDVYHTGNKPTPEEIGAMPIAVTTAVVG